MTAAKNMGKWHRGVERGAEALDSAWRHADLRQPNVQRHGRLVKLYSNYVCEFVLFCLVAVVSSFFLAVVYRRGVRCSWSPSLLLFTSFLV